MIKNENIINESILSAIKNILMLNKKFFIFFVIISLVLIYAYSFIMPYGYESTATLLPQKTSEGGSLSSFFQGMSGMNFSMGGIGQSNQSQMFAEILRSRSVAQFITDKCDLGKNPLFLNMSNEDIYNNIQNMIDVKVERSGLIKVTATVRTPYFVSPVSQDSIRQLASRFANFAVQGLDFILRQKTVSTAKKTRIYIERELENYNIRLDSVQSVLEKFQTDNKVLALDEQTKSIVNQAVDLGSELIKAEINLNLAKNEYDSNSPYLRTLQDNYKYIKEQYQKIQKGGLTSTDAFALNLDNVPKLARLYANLLREQKILEQVILYLETQRHQESIQEQKDVPSVETLDEALPPGDRSSPNRKFMLILGLLISSVLAFSLIIGYAILKGRLNLKNGNNNPE